MTMTVIAPGITQVATGRVAANSFLVEGEGELTLVDCGSAATAEAVLRELAGRELTTIVITHAHPDHVQGVAEVRDRTGARVLAHAGDAGWLAAGRVPAEGRSGLGARAFDRTRTAHWTPFEPDATIADGELIGDLRVVHTPGHSPGHLALVHEATRTALVGDAVFHTGKGLRLGPAGFAADPDARQAALTRLPADLAAVGFGHGAPLGAGGVAGFRAFVSG
jgi:glyoxylase-like metal-dependent hydrolase (beta-lactamase superfamily II)